MKAHFQEGVWLCGYALADLFRVLEMGESAASAYKTSVSVASAAQIAGIGAFNLEPQNATFVTAPPAPPAAG